MPCRSAAPSVPPTWRIRDRATFAALRRSRHRARAGVLSLTWLPGPASQPPRVGYAIGRGVGPAVVRNRVRRRLRAAIRQLAPDLAPGAYLVAPSTRAARASFAELRSSLATALAAATGSPMGDAAVCGGATDGPVVRG